jgi:hypothetical protein
MAHSSPFCALPVWVIRMYFADTGANPMTVVGVCPGPSATGAPQVVPSDETCTL